METCNEIFELLSAYLDHELPAVTCAEIEQHLARCPECVALERSLRSTVGLCHGYAPNQAPTPLNQQVRTQLFETYQKIIAQRNERGPS